MSVDVLQEKIRKLKNPSVVEFTLLPELIPPAVREELPLCDAYGRYCEEMLTCLKGTVPAVRFGFGTSVLLGSEGVAVLEKTLATARSMGYYIILDLPEILSTAAAEQMAALLAQQDSPWHYDALVLSPYLGTDILRPFMKLCKERKKALFAIARTANKSASEVQDLLTGTRLVHSAVTDIISRMGEPLMGKFGYSQVAAVIAAVSESSIKSIRPRNKSTFLLLDGYDYSFGNSRKCSYAFDKYGRGAACCAGASILGAWREEGAGEDYAAAALQAAQRMKKNLTAYVTIL